MLTNHKKQEFMRRESSYSTRGARTGANLLGWGDEECLSQEDQRLCLVAKLKSAEKEIISLPKKHPRRIELGQEKQELQNAISEIRRKSRRNLANYFVDVAKERLIRGQFDAFMNEAKRRFDADNTPPVQEEL